MNKIIQDQLKLVNVTKLNYRDTDTSIFIPRTIKILNDSLSKGRCYLIKLFDFVTNPPDTSTLASNWNNGIIPKSSIYIAEVVNKVGNMIQVNAVAQDNSSDRFYGWLPNDGFETIKNL